MSTGGEECALGARLVARREERLLVRVLEPIADMAELVNRAAELHAEEQQRQHEGEKRTERALHGGEEDGCGE